MCGPIIVIIVNKKTITIEVLEFFGPKQEKGLISIGSSLRIFLVEEGEAGIYPRLGLTMKHGKGAAHAIVNEAGCYLKNIHKITLRKNIFTIKNLLNGFQWDY